jgi:hypothetical protein
MNYNLINCPFCHHKLEECKSYRECMNPDCLNALATYKGFDSKRPEIIDYDTWMFIGGTKYIFFSAMYEDGGVITTLKDQGAKVLISKEVFTEPNVEAIEAMAHRLYKLLAFS